MIKIPSVESPFSFSCTDWDLEWQIALAAFVAGKNSRIQQRKLEEFMCRTLRAVFGETCPTQRLPHEWLGQLTEDQIDRRLRDVKSGQYTRLKRLIYQVFHDIAEGRLNLRECTRDRLAEYPGISMKSASFFLLFTRREAEDQIACLDVHILRYLRETGVVTDAPRNTPPKKKYLVIEQAWLKHKRELGRNGAELDFEIWLARSVKPKQK